MNTFYVEIVHIGTRETKVVEVEFYNDKIVSIRWPLAGVYDIDLKTNTMKARSPQARRKHPHCLWSAADVVALRRKVWELLNPDHKEREAAYQAHLAKVAADGIKKCPSTPKKPNRRRSRV